MLKKRITFFINSLGGGGAEGVCITLANSLSERGWQVTLAVLHLNNAVRQADLRDEVQLVVLDAGHARTAWLPLWGFLRKYKPERILVFNHQLAILLILFRTAFGFNFKIVARNINTLSQKKETESSFWHKHFVHGVTKLLYRKADRIVAQSKGMAEDLIVSYGVPEHKVNVIYNPICRAINQAEGEKPVKQDYLLCAGRLEPVKAFHHAINTFAIIANNYPSLHLKIVGKGSLESQLKKQAKVLGVADRVSFEGYQTDMVPYYLGAKATLLTSQYEGFPNVLIESIALGTPVVAFDCRSGPDEIVVEGVNGFLIPQDEAELTSAIHKILATDWPCIQVAQTARSFRPDLIIERYENVLLR